ncbi:MAG: hypothetical protein ACOC9W_06225, partial [Persicimonas sp.]
MKSNFQRLLVLLAAGLLFAAGCEQDQREADGEQEGKEVIEEDDEAEEPAVDKLVYAFQPQENPEAITPDAEKLAEYLEEQTGIESEVYLPTNYAGV